jgi:hypothetical protein
MDGIHQGDRVINGRLLQDTVAQIKNMSGAAGGLIENIFRSAANFFAIRQQDCWIEIALDGAVVSHGGPSFVEPDSPINTDDCAAAFGQ